MQTTTPELHAAEMNARTAISSFSHGCGVVMRREWRDGRWPVRGWRLYLTSVLLAGGYYLFARVLSIGLQGFGFFELVFWVLLFLVVNGLQLLCAWLPISLAAGSITRDREQGLLDMLFLTRLGTAEIIIGRLAAALKVMAIVIVLPLCVIVATLPSLGWGNTRDMLWALGVMLAFSVALTSIGLYCSARFRRTATAVGVVYLVAGCLVIFPVVFVTPLLVIFAGVVVMGDIISLVWRGIFRRLPIRWAVLAVAAVVTVPPAVVAYLSTNDTDSTSRSLCFLLGSPFLPAIFLAAEFTDTAEIWYLNHIPLLTILIHLLVAWAFTSMAIGRLERMRRGG